MQFGLVFKGSPWSSTLYRFVRLSDGVTVTALLEHSEPVNGNYASCGFGYPRASAMFQSFFGPSPHDLQMFGFAPGAPNCQFDSYRQLHRLRRIRLDRLNAWAKPL